MSLKHAFTAGGLVLFAGPVLAQAGAPAPFPSKQLHFVVPFPAGGTLDVLARAVSSELGPALGQTVVIENRPGASGLLGAELVARAAPDGHTLVIVSNTLVTLPALRKDLPFDVLRDFAPVIELGSTPTVVTVHPSFAARDLKTFIEVARKATGGPSYNSPGIASPPHLAGELLARAAGIPLVHVSYRGTQPAVTDLVAGHIQVMMAPLNAVLPFIREKQLYPIAVTDAERTRYLPDVPTLREAGVTNMPPVTSWFAVLTTGGSPPAAISRLNAEISKILHDQKVDERLASQTFEIRGGSPEQLAARMRGDAATTAAIVAQARITAE
jgi:tripartite-type tricarboxylate transporter receptor subunit TctC